MFGVIFIFMADLRRPGNRKTTSRSVDEGWKWGSYLLDDRKPWDDRKESIEVRSNQSKTSSMVRLKTFFSPTGKYWWITSRLLVVPNFFRGSTAWSITDQQLSSGKLRKFWNITILFTGKSTNSSWPFSTNMDRSTMLFMGKSWYIHYFNGHFQ